MARKKTSEQKKTNDLYSNYIDKLENQVQSNQSKLSMILGVLIVLVIGFLVFNYFNRDKSDLGPAQTTQKEKTEDVSVDKLPGKYTVKEGDSLFLIAQNYYQDGFKFEEIAKANNLSDVNSLEVGQVLEIPKLEASAPTLSAQPSPTPQSPAVETSPPPSEQWGPPITADTYTVVEGDWLSKIAGRAYGDIMTYKRLAQANNIPNPDLIYPGQVIKIPR